MEEIEKYLSNISIELDYLEKVGKVTQDQEERINDFIYEIGLILNEDNNGENDADETHLTRGEV